MNSYKEIRESLIAIVQDLETGTTYPVSGTLREGLGEVRRKLEAENFHVVVMGQFKRGKTTFINSLLGAEVLPSSVVPLTSINTVIRYGEKLGATVHFLDGGVKEIAAEALPDFVTEKGNPENRLRVRYVEVHYPSPFLRDGVSLVDTPGTGSTYLHNDETAYSFLEHADAVIFMLSADPPVSRSELEFLHRIRSSVRKVFFVQNKVDYLGSEDLDESLAFNHRVISEAVDLEEVVIHPLSAKTALKAAVAGDAALLERSGLPGFTAVLEEFLMREKGRLLLESCARKLRRLLEDEYASLELEFALLKHPFEELEGKVKSFREQMGSISREREEVRFLIRGDHERLIKESLDEEVERFKREQTEPLLERFDAFLERNAALSGSALNAALSDFIRTEIMETFISWRHTQEERLSQAFRSMASLYMEKANAIANRILEIAGEHFGLTLPRLEAEIVLSDEGEFWFKMEDPLTDLEVFIGALTNMLPRGLSRRLIRKRRREELLTLFDRHCGRVRYDFFLRLQKSMGALSYRVDEVIQGTLEAIERGIEKALGEIREGAEALQAVQDELAEKRRALTEARNRLEKVMGQIASEPRAS
ncbi:dynamin family protein [Candidatus Solincola tengchongensis]|uniref:dynamin family protein n=1 Tax=Candidatus Solincola tengchongensis TaxID=2900693 RepID=UPI00257FC696|nr:dynamin family protein [Candidatus Solincola tengchongensis]